MRLRRFLSCLMVLAGVLLITVPEDAFGKPRSRSSSRSRSRAAKPRASKPKSSSSSNKGWGSSSKKKGVSKPRKSKVQQKADRAAYEKSKASGKAFGNRKAAMSKFSSNPANAKKYTSNYASKPATRPGHIPATYAGTGGTTYNISYNQGHGGYGYMNTLGTFMLYNAMSDMAMRPYYDRQMASAGYHVGPAPVVQSGFGMGGILVTLIVVGGIVVVVVVLGKGS